MNKNIKILVVNNQQSSPTSDTLAVALENLKLKNLTMVHNTKDAITEIISNNTQEPFDVVFIHELPNNEEINLLKSIVEINSNTYLVMLANSLSADKVLNFIKSGASGILSNPFTVDQVRVELEKYTLIREDKKQFYG